MQKTMIIGIDPGLSGAVAVVDTSSPLGLKLVEVFDTPIFEINERKHVDVYQLWSRLEKYKGLASLAVVEDVHAFTYTNKKGEVRGQSARSSFNFGKSAGIVLGMLAALSVPIHETKPAVWKRLMGCTADKDLSRKKASIYFPKDVHNWPLKKHDGRAEAALLAVFGTRLA